MTTPLDNDPKNNPLINPPKMPHDAPPLAQVKTEHFLPALKAAIAEAEEEVARIRDNKAAPTFENTIEALEFSGSAIARVNGVFGTISSSNSNDEIRAMEEEFGVEGVKHSNNVMMDAALFARVKKVYDGKAALKLTGEQKMLLEETYKGFIRSGALLNAADKKRFCEISEELSKLTTQFQNNTVMATAASRKVIDDEKDLAGLPPRVKQQYKDAADKAAKKDPSLKGKWLIQMSPPPMEIFEYSENRALREEIYRMRTTIGYGGKHDNRPLVTEIVKLRHEKALLLGYDNFAAYVLADRMAKTPEAVMDFLEENRKTYRPAAEDFLKQVKDFALKTDGLADLKPWDFSFYRQKLQKDLFDFDPEELRPYFELDKVLKGLRTHAEKLFNIKMTAVDGKYEVTNPDVKVYEISDAKTNKFLSVFYADYYAREGAKRNGAWMNTIRDGGQENGKKQPPLVSNDCNFPKPRGKKPTLLSLDEFLTLFHEFGHGLHAMLGDGIYKSLNGIHVKWDFVELPSQLQENWGLEKEVLDSFAVHHKTGKPMPAELIKKIHDYQNFGAGYDGLRQTFNGLLDMAWHTTDPADIKSIEQLEDSVIAQAALFPRESGAVSTSFGHLFADPTGYAAGYYSYKWAEVLDADVFADFKKKGLYNAERSQCLRDTIYSKGGTVDPMELFIAMMGRKPDSKALYRREGLLPEEKKAGKAPKVPKPPKAG